MKEFSVVGIGELLWDLLPSGPQLGGAPANFAYHARALGARSTVVSRVGRDRWGDECFARLKSMGLPVATLQLEDQAPTGTVTVTLAEGGMPHYTIHENVAWDRIEVTPAGLDVVQSANAICFGTLAQRSSISRATIQQLVAATSKNALRIFDINLRQHFFTREIIAESLTLGNVLKVNETELPHLAALFDLRGDERVQIATLAKQFHLQAVAYTRGGNGSLLFARDRWSDHPGIPTEVVDTVGAGDAFTAAMTLGLLADWDLDEINRRANAIAAYVASCAGATPASPEALRAPFRPDSKAQEQLLS